MAVIVHTGCIHCFHNRKITVNTIRSAVTVLYTHTGEDISVSINDSSSLHLLCTVTDKRLLKIAVSVYCLSVCSLPPPPLSISVCLTNNWGKKKNSLFVNWPGSAERIVAKCNAACLSLTFRLFCSAFHQQTKRKKKPSQSR